MAEKVFRLYVENRGQKSIKILQYIDKNLQDIMTFGVRVKVIPIDMDDVPPAIYKQLKLHKICKVGDLPALIIDKKRKKIGVSNIKALFDKNIRALYKTSQSVDNNYTHTGNPDLDRYYQTEMNVNKEDVMSQGFQEEDEGDKLDSYYSQRMREQMQRRKIEDSDQINDDNIYQRQVNAQMNSREEKYKNGKNKSGGNARQPKNAYNTRVNDKDTEELMARFEETDYNQGATENEDDFGGYAANILNDF